jgi:hypothetical protein
MVLPLLHRHKPQLRLAVSPCNFHPIKPHCWLLFGMLISS